MRHVSQVMHAVLAIVMFAACRNPPYSTLAILRDSVVREQPLTCLTPDAVAIPPGDTISAREKRLCTNGPLKSATDTMIIVSLDDRNRVLEIARLWMPRAPTSQALDSLRARLAAIHGAPQSCEDS